MDKCCKYSRANMSVCLCVCLTVSVCIFVCVCLSVCVSVDPSVCLSVCLSTRLSVCVRLTVCVPVCDYPSVSLSTLLPVYPSAPPFVFFIHFHPLCHLHLANKFRLFSQDFTHTVIHYFFFFSFTHIICACV